MSIVLQSSGGGSVTINEPTTASNFTLSLPASTGTVLTTGSPQSGGVIQVVNSSSGAVATGSTAMSTNNTIPQNTAGTEFLTVTITPKFSTSKLLVFGQMYLTTNTTTSLAMAIFQDSTANALSAAAFYEPTSTGQMTFPISVFLTAGTTSATTFKIRAGTSGGNTVTFNGNGGTRDFGGVACSSITVMEIAA
jgi:hypothetical protein